LRLEASVEVHIPDTQRLRHPIVDEMPRHATLSVTLISPGRKTQVCEIRAGLADGGSHRFDVLEPMPIVIEARHQRSCTLRQGVEAFAEGSGVTSLYAVDGVGGHWELHQVDFLQLQQEARSALRRLAAEEAAAIERERADSRAADARFWRDQAALITPEKDEETKS
jgi:hypothetical protein